MIVEVFSKKSQATPLPVIQTCWRRLNAYDKLWIQRPDDEDQA